MELQALQPCCGSQLLLSAAPRGLSWAEGGSSPHVIGCCTHEVSHSSSLTLEVDELGKIWMGLCDSKMQVFPVAPVSLDDNFMSAY